MYRTTSGIKWFTLRVYLAIRNSQSKNKHSLRHHIVGDLMENFFTLLEKTFGLTVSPFKPLFQHYALHITSSKIARSQCIGQLLEWMLFTLRVYLAIRNSQSKNKHTLRHHIVDDLIENFFTLLEKTFRLRVSRLKRLLQHYALHKYAYVK